MWDRTLPCPPDQPACPWCGGQPSFREIPYQGTGSSGMEAPDLTIGCPKDGFWFPKQQTEQYTRGKGYKDTRAEAEFKLLHDWGDRGPVVSLDDAQRLLDWYNPHAAVGVEHEANEALAGRLRAAVGDE